MSDLVPADIIRSPRLEIATRVHEMDTPTLRGELARALTVTAETLEYLAAIWRELERRGQDLSELRKGMGQYLPLIAAATSSLMLVLFGPPEMAPGGGGGSVGSTDAAQKRWWGCCIGRAP